MPVPSVIGSLRLILLSALLGTYALVAGDVRAGRSEQTATPLVTEDNFAKVHDLAASAFLAGQLDEALAGFNRAIEINPESSLAYYNRASVYFAKGDYDRAVADFTQALRLKPNFAFAYMNRGISFSSLGKLDEALRDLDQSVGLEVKSSDPLFNRAVVHARRGEVGKALADYEAAIARDANDQEAIAARARLMALLGPDSTAGNSSGPKDPSRLPAPDTTRIPAEIEHARHVEHLLRLVDETCVAHGDDHSELVAAARTLKWRAASPEALAKASSPLAKMVGGWTFSDRFGSYAIMQSTGVADPRVSICSVTTRLGSAHLMDDLKAGFEHHFKTTASGTIDRPGQTTLQYRILREDKSEIRSSLVFAAASDALTARFLFEKK